MNSNEGKQKFFVVYKITNLIDGKIYIGAHVTYNVNDKYMGSSKYLKRDIKELGRKNFKKDILHVFDNKENMMGKEAEIVNREFCHRTDTYNKHVGGVMEFTWSGMIVTKDNEGNIHSVYNDDPRYLSGELVGVMKGISSNKDLISVKDKEDNFFKVKKDDLRYLSGELVGQTKGYSPTLGFDGKKHSENSKKIIGYKNSIKQKGSNNVMYGKNHTKESKEEMRSKLAFCFFVYDKEGNFVSKEIGIKKYAVENNMHDTKIVRVLKGKSKHTNFLRFFYEYQGELINKL